MMKVAFRADASLQIGTGHVMRCLTLADALVTHGIDCQFICREHPGNLLELIRSKGYIVHVLPSDPSSVGMSSLDIKTTNDERALAHSHWLGATQAEDAAACEPILGTLKPDWLVVDHYALDAAWELAVKPHFQRLMVIDDLADRTHACDLLLDQTLGRDKKDYRAWVPGNCQLLCGSQYALLRREFAALRPYSLKRRVEPRLRELLITMGGVDKSDSTSKVLQSLRVCPLPADCRITVVMGSTAPWLSEVANQAQSMPWPTRVLVGVSDMAQLMADCDLAIGAAGATSWERCCLGLPAVMLVLADNQRTIAQALCDVGAAQLVDTRKLADQPLITSELIEHRALRSMAAAALAVTDGLGAKRAVDILTTRPRYANQSAV